MTSFNPRTALRSPRAILDGYIILPRLIDKVRAHARGELPAAYHRNLLRPGVTLDGRFLAFTGLDGDTLQKAILSSDGDEAIALWVMQHARPHSEEEKRAWASEVDGYRPSGRVLLYLEATVPELATKVDFTRFSLLDLIDMDEGRLPLPSPDDCSDDGTKTA